MVGVIDGGGNVGGRGKEDREAGEFPLGGIGKAERDAGDDAVSGDSFDSGGNNSEFDSGILVSKERE